MKIETDIVLMKIKTDRSSKTLEKDINTSTSVRRRRNPGQVIAFRVRNSLAGCARSFEKKNFRGLRLRETSGRSTFCDPVWYTIYSIVSDSCLWFRLCGECCVPCVSSTCMLFLEMILSYILRSRVMLMWSYVFMCGAINVVVCGHV
jgi:hypothetical protein